MPWFDVIWTPDIIAHLARHDVTPDEFEEVVSSAHRVDPNKTAGRFEVIGLTSSQRRLKCVFEYVDGITILPVTAFEP